MRGLFRGLSSSSIAACLVLTATSVSAAAITSLIGDKDGFGIGVHADESFLPGSLPGMDGPGDPDGTDKWFYNQQSIVHNYTLPVYPINTARLEVFTGGQGFDPINPEGAPTSVFLNGTFIGYLTIGDIYTDLNALSNIARKDAFLT